MVKTQLDFSSAYHPQTDGQMEVVNNSLSDLLRCLTGEHVKSWNQKLCQTKFTHNHAVSRSTGFSPFQVCYSIVPCGPLYFIQLPSKTRVHDKAEEFVGGLQEIHKQVHDNLVQETVTTSQVLIRKVATWSLRCATLFESF